MNSLDEQLYEQLHASAASLSVPPGDLSQVVARTRTRRHRQTLAVITSAALLGGAMAGVTLARRGHRAVTVAAAGGPAAASIAKLGDVAVVWQKVDPHSALGYSNAIASGGALYALSTAPGLSDPTATTSSPPRQLYRSVDGVEWTEASGPTHAYISDLSASGDQLYVVGTGPATVGVEGALAPVVVGSSADRGATWHQVQLPIDTAAIQAGTLSSHSQVVHVASSAKGVVVVAQAGGDLNVTRFLPPGVTAPDGWVVTQQGVDLLGPINSPACPAGMTTTPPGKKGALGTAVTRLPGGPGSASTPGLVPPTYCWNGAASSTPSGAPAVIAPEANHPIVRSLSWAQLGVSGDLQQAALGNPFVFFSADGQTFGRVTLPALPGQMTQIQLATDGARFVMAATSTIKDPGVGEARLWQSTDGLSWTPTPAPPADQASPLAVGYLAGRLTTISGYSASGPTMATLGSGGWSETGLATLVGPTPTGTRLDAYTAAMGPFGVAVVVSEVLDPASSPTAQRAGGSPVVSLLISRDGTTWSHQDINSLAGGTVSQVPNLVVTSNRFVVTAQFAPPNTTTAAPETVLVGTAR